MTNKGQTFNLEFSTDEIKMLTAGMRQWALDLIKSTEEMRKTNPDYQEPEKTRTLLRDVKQLRDNLGQLVGESFWGKER
jgi:hypothetical protein